MNTQKIFKIPETITSGINIMTESMDQLMREGRIDLENGIITKFPIFIFDSPSRNMNAYPREIAYPAIFDDLRISEKWKNGTLLGEINHPNMHLPEALMGKNNEEILKYVHRIEQIDETKVSHMISNLVEKDGMVYADIKYIYPMGQQVLDILKHPSKKTQPAMSLRSLSSGDVKKEIKGKMCSCPQGDFRVITFDNVSLPGFTEARIDRTNFQENLNGYGTKLSKVMAESQNTNMRFNIPDLIHLLKKQEYYSAFENSVGIKLESANFSIDNNQIIITEMYTPLNGKKAIIPHEGLALLSRIL